MENLGLFSYDDVEKLNGNDELGCGLIDIVEGCLVDNLLFFSSELNQYIVCLEYYLNTWSSCLDVYVGDMDEAYKMWDELKEKYECA